MSHRFCLYLFDNRTAFGIGSRYYITVNRAGQVLCTCFNVAYKTVSTGLYFILYLLNVAVNFNGVFLDTFLNI